MIGYSGFWRLPVSPPLSGLADGDQGVSRRQSRSALSRNLRCRRCEYSSVEDDPLIREFVVEALREEGFHVVHAANGEEALAWCGRRVVDVLITDVKLPGSVDGWQIAERCREHDPGLPVIYATGFSPVVARPVRGSLTLQAYRPSRTSSGPSGG